MKKPAPFGKYFLLERINVGGMAEVFRAKAFGVEGFERLVAVKRILPNIAEDKEFIRMFIEEAKLAVQLNHANIAQIFDLGVVDGAYYIALEHVHGRDLRGTFDRCRQQGEAMPVAQACFIVMKVCEGLDYAHNKRDQSGREISLVHRDVSPQNVLVSFEGEVKLIDFGIAKAAGKGSKTQAGILKGKFGYMSPEQVRGLPIDRRSDVFSCGIVLYELLTGERLFVGESDFSTLEKVRNVEILPPSTYNRKIPDELERIVLKALAKDTEDRYQNAIDLHDELQAFVYTAGEFYSRKDLAGWMKKTFGKEIEEETAKLESYRQLKPPPAEAPATPRTITGQRSTGQAASPPPPVRRSSKAGMDAVQGTKPPPPPANGRVSQQMPAIAASAAVPASKRRKTHESGPLTWDDDELETQIYDNPEDDPKNRGPIQIGKAPAKNLPLVAAPTPSPEAMDALDESPRMTTRGMSATPDIPSLASASSATASPTMTGAAPDLSSLVSATSKGWASGQGPSPAATLNGIGANGALGTGSNGAAVALPPDARQPLFDSQHRIDRSAPFDPMASFGSGMLRQKGDRRGLMLMAVGGAVVAAIAVVVVIAMSGDEETAKPTTETPTVAVKPTVVPDPQTTVGGDQNTGFDLYVSPAGVTQWKLDGESRTDRLPSRIRGISPGTHSVAIDPPPGFMSHSQQVNVEMGKAPKVEIVLSPVDGIHGVFESTPPGATVSLIIDGKRSTLGPSPAKAPLDPRMTYQVLFEKPGYVSVNRPIVLSGGVQEKVVVALEKTSAVAAVTPPVTKPDSVAIEKPVTKPDTKIEKPVTKIEKPVTKPDVKPDTKIEKPDPKPDPDTKVAASGSGMLMLGSKPSCEIYVDGSNTGLHTPQRTMKLSAGKHRITLINNEFGIKETFVVDIKPDATEKAIKDFSDRLPK
ncbi:MAG: serine/threonine protein kinase [Myxococcales bacterium]|nr:serine/threonine protein kinase [Myxococcales bacterium]